MSELAVFVEFGGSKHRVGTAYQQQDGGFTLVLGGTLSLGPGQAVSSRGGAPGASGGAFGGGSGTFPNYGRSKGAPIFGAAMQELEYYAANARKSLNDPSKARWHDKERQLLEALEAEITRQGGTVQREETHSYGGPIDDSGLPF